MVATATEQKIVVVEQQRASMDNDRVLRTEAEELVFESRRNQPACADHYSFRTAIRIWLNHNLQHAKNETKRKIGHRWFAK